MANNAQKPKSVTNNKASSKIVASKKKFSLSRKQITIISIAGVFLLGIGGYFGWQAYQDNQSNASSCVSNTYKKGSSGTCVRYIQRMLNGMYKEYLDDMYGKVSTLKVDGSYGTATTDTVSAWQDFARLSKDGKVGKATWKYMCSVAGSADNAHNDAWNAAKSAGCSVKN